MVKIEKEIKILLTHELFPPDIAGGGEKLMLKLAQHLIGRGYSIKVVTSGDPKIKSYMGIETIRIPANRYLMNVLALPTILRHAKDADIIQTSSGNICIPSYIAARILNKPIYCWVHHVFGKYWRDIRGPIIGRLFEFIEWFYLNLGYDFIIFQNLSSRDIGIESGVRPEKIMMINPGVEHAKFSTKGTGREKTALFVGSISMSRQAIKSKGMEYLIRAAEMLQDVDFTLVGGFESEIDSLPKNVNVVGPKYGEELTSLYKKAGVFVCSSLNEGFGLTILEAMASGCAIVSTIDIGQVGKIVKPKDVEGLADGIRYYIDNPKQAGLDGIKNRKLAGEYSFDKNINTLHKKILESIG